MDLGGLWGRGCERTRPTPPPYGPAKVNPDTCVDTCRIRVKRQIRFEYGYVWTWKFLKRERKSCGFKNIRIRVDKA